jgi:hypothetical protein
MAVLEPRQIQVAHPNLVVEVRIRRLLVRALATQQLLAVVVEITPVAQGLTVALVVVVDSSQLQAGGLVIHHQQPLHKVTMVRQALMRRVIIRAVVVALEGLVGQQPQIMVDRLLLIVLQAHRNLTLAVVEGLMLELVVQTLGMEPVQVLLVLPLLQILVVVEGVVVFVVTQHLKFRVGLTGAAAW